MLGKLALFIDIVMSATTTHTYQRLVCRCFHMLCVREVPFFLNYNRIGIWFVLNAIWKINYQTVSGIDFKQKLINLDGVPIKLQIWDTAGQERFRTLTTAYYRGAMGILLMYDVTSLESFNNLSYWLRNIQEVTCSFILEQIHFY